MNNNMYLYFDSNGYLKEFITCPARAGSENVNSIYFYVEPSSESDRNKTDSNGDAYYALPNNLDHGVLTFKLHDVLDGVTDENGVVLNSLAFTSANFRIEDIQPFDKKRDLLFFKWFQKYQFVKVDLTADILLNAGNVECTIGCYNSSNTKVYNLDLFSFYVADSAVQSANYVTTSQYHMLLALMQSGLSGAVMRYNVSSGDTLADIYDLIGTQISVLNIDDKEYLVEMSGSGSIVLYDLYNREWYAYEGSDETAIDDVTRYLYRYHIATKEYVDDNVFEMTMSPMTLTQNQVDYLVKNNVRIKYDGFLFEHAYIDNDNDHIYVCAYMPIVVSSNTAISFPFVVLNTAGMTLTHSFNNLQIYNQAQADALFATKQELANFGNLFTYKGTASVSEINALTDIGNGWAYNLTDSGTLTLGNLQVETGDNVAFDGSVWTKLSSETILGQYYTKQEGQEFETQVDNRVDAIENQVQQVASGSPKGVYATLAALQAAYPTGTTGVYVVSADGHWYYWNGSAWTDGGTYQATQIADGSVTRAKLDELLKEDTDFSSQQKENNIILENEVFSFSDPTPAGTISNSQAQRNGNYITVVQGDETYKMLQLDYPQPGFVKISCTSKLNNAYGIGFACIDNNFNITYAYYYNGVSTGSGVNREIFYNIPQGTRRIYVNARYDLTPSIKYVNKLFYDKYTIDLFLRREKKLVNFTPIYGKYISYRGNLITESSGSCSNPIKVRQGDIIHWTSKGYQQMISMISTCDADFSNISAKVISDSDVIREYTYMATEDCYIVVSWSNIGNPQYSLYIETTSVDENNYVDLSLFNNFGVVGDSYASGELYYNSAYHDKYDISWGKILARGLGTNCINFSKGGLTTRSWLTNTTYGLALMQSSPAQDIYYLCLGINDYYSLGADYLGSLTDITSHESYEDYADSFYGNYGRIIENILEHAPYAKIIMVTMVENAGLAASFNNAIIEIANHYNIPYIVQSDHPYFSTNQYLDMVAGHPRALGYSGMAKAFKELIEECIKNNYDYFKDAFMHD